MNSFIEKKVVATLMSSDLVDTTRTVMPATQVAILDCDASIFSALAAMIQQKMSTAIVVNGPTIVGTLSFEPLASYAADLAMEMEQDYTKLCEWIERGQSFMSEATRAACIHIESAEELLSDMPPLAYQHLLDAKSLVSQIPILMEHPEQSAFVSELIDTGTFLSQLIATLRHSATPRGIRIHLLPAAQSNILVNSQSLGQSLRRILETSLQKCAAGSVINISSQLSYSGRENGEPDSVNIQVGLQLGAPIKSLVEARGPQNWIPENLIQSMLRNLTETHTNSNFSNNRSAEGILLEISLPIVTAHEYERSQLKSIRILVVEDDDDIRELIVETLSRAGYSVGSAVNGQEAIEQFHAHRPSLVLTDIYMPVLDGIALAEQIKKLEPNMPIIVFSGQYTNLLQDRIDGILKCDHVLYKPFAQKDVLESVHLLT